MEFSIEMLGWILLVATMILILIVLMEISRNNHRREVGRMFATEKFEEKIKPLNLSEKEQDMLERLVRQSSFSNKDSILNSPLLFEEAVNFVYKLNGGAEKISPADRQKAWPSGQGCPIFLHLYPSICAWKRGDASFAQRQGRGTNGPYQD